MKIATKIAAGWLALAAAFAVAQATGSQPAPKANPGSQKAQAGGADRGQQVFKQNCARCHNSPEGFSPSISGTISRHMRVRAGLSDEDYQALLKYFNP
jgi:mono/diheme cytochrome c family protein